MYYNNYLYCSFKQFTLDQDKAFPPKETVRRFSAKLNAAGPNILEKVVQSDNGQLDIPVRFSICGEDTLSILSPMKQMGKTGQAIQNY